MRGRSPGYAEVRSSIPFGVPAGPRVPGGADHSGLWVNGKNAWRPERPRLKGDFVAACSQLFDGPVTDFRVERQTPERRRRLAEGADEMTGTETRRGHCLSGIHAEVDEIQE